MNKLIGDYLYTERLPLHDNIIEIMNVTPRLKNCRKITQRILDKIVEYAETFIDGVKLISELKIHSLTNS